MIIFFNFDIKKKNRNLSRQFPNLIEEFGNSLPKPERREFLPPVQKMATIFI